MYDSLLINGFHHTSVRYTDSEVAARAAINKKKYKGIRTIGKELWEIESGKRAIKVSMPIYLGVHVLNRACWSLHMILSVNIYVKICSMP